MKNLYSTLFLVLLHKFNFGQIIHISAGINYSWLDKIESSVQSRQVVSPGIVLSFGRDFFTNDKVSGYANVNLNWLNGGAIWKHPDSDVQVKSNYNISRLELEGGISISLNEKFKYAIGLNNSFGVKIKSNFDLSEQNTFRNWSPIVVSRLVYKKNETTNWAFSLKAALGLHVISYTQAVNSNVNLRYESSNNHVAIEVRRYLRKSF